MIEICYSEFSILKYYLNNPCICQLKSSIIAVPFSAIW
uniref:Uncharacterized protein n=1 Tax=Rhizophora mucronata TaxID=61149 RepID=A0A2P2NBN5_RHIMU